jgi:hypothetical protein
MALAIEQFLTNPADRQFCFVWTRQKDNVRVVFGCDTKENCEKQLTHYSDRAHLADKNGWESM